MVSQDDDSSQRVALFLVFGLIALIVASVLVFGASRAGGKHKASTAVAAVPLTQSSGAATHGAAQAAADAASVTVEQGVVKFYFASGKADLAAGASEALADMVKAGKEGRTLVISGFHDATGSAEKNAELAKQRALAVRDAVMAAGVPEGHIELKKPEQVNASGSNAEARRVEITIQ